MKRGKKRGNENEKGEKRKEEGSKKVNKSKIGKN
jgi:hypothetical protein